MTVAQDGQCIKNHWMVHFGSNGYYGTVYVMWILSQLKNTFERETNSGHSLMGRIGELQKGKRLLQRLTTELPADPGQVQMQVYQDLHTHVHSGHRWKQPKCPLMEGCRNTRCSLHTMEHQSAIKRNKVPATTWMDLENIVLSEGARHKQPPMIWFHVAEMSRIGKSVETESR